jgi:hypothetical protein
MVQTSAEKDENSHMRSLHKWMPISWLTEPHIIVGSNLGCSFGVTGNQGEEEWPIDFKIDVV